MMTETNGLADKQRIYLKISPRNVLRNCMCILADFLSAFWPISKLLAALP
jgi:hypothetical protein